MQHINFITTTNSGVSIHNYIGKPILDDDGNKIGEIIGVDAMVSSASYTSNGMKYVALIAKFNEGFTMRKSLDVGVSVGYTDQLRKGI